MRSSLQSAALVAPLSRFLLLFPPQAICQLLTEVQAYFDAAVAVLQVIWCPIAGVST